MGNTADANGSAADSARLLLAMEATRPVAAALSKTTRCEADDLLHTAFVQASRTIGHSNPEDTQAWFAGVLRHVASHYRRSERVREQASLEDVPNEYLPPDGAPSPDELSQRREAAAAREQVSGRLSRVEQKMLVLHIDEGKSVASASEELGLSKSSGMRVWTRVLKLLRRTPWFRAWHQAR
jgi:RNA polymerase sigma factor (sigma-70 family)